MKSRTLLLAAMIYSLTSLPLVRSAWAASLCQFVAGEATCTLEPSGVCTSVGPVSIDGNHYSVEIQRVDLGAPLRVSEDGAITGVASEDFWIHDNGVRFTTFGEATFTPTDNPAIFRVVERTDLVAANRRYDSGVIVAHGEVDLAEGKATISLVGKLCRSPRSD